MSFMVTPTKDEIRARALELFFLANPQTTITPEDYELKESGFWQEAQTELMQGISAETLSYVEQMAHDLGLRVVSEADHDKLIDIELRVSRIKEKEKKLKALKEELEKLKKEFDKEGKPKIVTVEKIVEHIRFKTRKRRKKRLVEKLLKCPHAKLLISNPETLEDLLTLDELDALPEPEIFKPLPD